ncbi:MAG: nuclear transport factor 2 family protein [Gammaproteobacteria bacterium]|nr:nuclear transport factor 2 family protein [Gammaproteobacteria bacterium]
MSLRLRQTGHAYIEVIQAYYQGCNTADAILMQSTFTEDVVHYFVDHGAVTGAQALANYWVKAGPRTQAHWTLDHALVEEPEAVIEWSMRWTPVQTDEPEILRGSEWFLFRDGKIAEIRAYHANHYLSNVRNRELWDFPYASRGYRTR